MGAALGVLYAIKRIFLNENGFLVGIREVIALLFLEFSYKWKKSRLDLYDPWSDDVSSLEKVSFIIPQMEKFLEYPRQLDHETEMNGMFFCGFNASQEKLVVKITRNKVGMAIPWIYFKLKDGRIFTLPTEKQFRVPHMSRKQSFTAGGLRFWCIEAMRKWRIAFTGLLKEQGKSEEPRPRTVFVKFSIIWSASSFVYDSMCDVSTRVMAKYFLSEKLHRWKGELAELSTNFDNYIQAGSMIGTFKIEEQDEQELFLWGAKKGSLVNVSKQSAYTETEYLAYAQEGELLYFSSVECTNRNTRFVHGSIVEATSLGGAVDSCQIEEDEQNCTITFCRGKFNWMLKFQDSEIGLQFYNINGTQSAIRISSVTLNEESGNGLIIKTDYSSSLQLAAAPTFFIPNLDTSAVDKSSLVLSLKETHAREISLSGGKGYSLANLRLLSSMDNKFTVPKGIVVSCTAYEEFINHACLAEDISTMEKSAWQEDAVNLQTACERLSSKVREADLSTSTKRAVRNALDKEFGASWENISLAVRSSATGEDAEEMSAAGQLKTFLGIEGSEKVYRAIVNCWASQFEFLPIRYKRQYGQILNSPMAVVIQEMVAADSAGVMFTCDPVTGNPANITISANYGIGMSVVSASSEPDTVLLTRNEDGETKFKDFKVGSKASSFLLKDGAIVEEAVSKEMALKCCLQKEEALRLGALGIMVEEVYGCPVDIEWAVKDDNIYLLQARPITTFHRETDFEIIHETDSSTRREGDWFTTANVGEVYPGATTYLGFTSFMNYSETSMARVVGKRGKTLVQWSPYFRKFASLSANHVFFSVSDILLRYYNGSTNLIASTMNLSMCGRVLDNCEMLATAKRRNEYYPYVFKPLQTYYFVTDSLFACMKLKKRQKAFPLGTKYEIPENLSAEEIFYKICHQWLSFSDPLTSHTECGIFSCCVTMVLMTILTNKIGGYNNDALSDAAFILSNCSEVESAGVPTQIRQLACSISKSEYNNEFKNMDCQDALLWLETSTCEIGLKFRNFLKKHGHRCIKEMDLRSTPWGDNALPLVKVLQQMVTPEDLKLNQRASPSTCETIRKLKTEKTWKQRFLLMIIIPFCRKAVGLREQSKSFMINYVACMRHSYRHLARQMVAEGRLPDTDLLYFVTHFELHELLQTRSPRIIQKAIRRRTMFPVLDKVVFPETCQWLPKSIDYSEQDTTPRGSKDKPQKEPLSINGVPMSQGIAIGKARVVTSIEEATAIQHGEILIAYSTDIGWSPYFPMLAGVATELGGLVSHGAVVAREYGLPCVVGVYGATSKFRTGNRVVIDGTKGTITLLEA